MRLLWSLPKAAPALLRHLAAYIDLAGLDLARAHKEIAAQLVATGIAVLCVLFAVLLGCLAVVAYTWDTPNRVSAILWMGGGFLLVAIVAGIYRSSLKKSQVLGSVRRAWQEDQVLLERILSSDED